MACGGLKAFESALNEIYNKNSTQRVINLALSMMNYSKKLLWGDSEKIIIKIGIHYGPVLAGVIGYHKPQFSLIGDTVNTTSRVCSTGEESTITISKAAYDRISGIFKNKIFVERVVQAKGKGEIITYQLRSRNRVENSSPKALTPYIPIRSIAKKMYFKGDHTNFNITKNNQELITITKNIRKNNKKQNLMQKIISGNTKPEAPIFQISNPKHSKMGSPRLFHKENRDFGFISHFSDNDKKFYFDLNVDNPTNNIINNNMIKRQFSDNKIEAVSLNRRNSELKNNLIDEASITLDKNLSYQRFCSNNSKSDNFAHSQINLLQRVESLHLKALLDSNNLVIDKIDKVEQYPGQFKFAENLQLEKNVISPETKENDDEFFDKLKIKEDTLDVLIFDNTWLSLNGSNSSVIEEYRKKIIENHHNEDLISMSIFCLIFLSNTCLFILKINEIQNFNFIMSLRAIMNIFNFLNFVLLRKKSSDFHVVRIVLLLWIFTIMTELLMEFFITHYLGMENNLEIILFYLISINFSYISFLDSLILVSYASCFLLLYGINQFNIEFFINIFFLIFCLMMILNNLRVKILSFYRNFNTLRVNNVKKNQQNNLVVNLLPSHILEKFLRNPNKKMDLTDEFEEVTILFADIAGFTKYSSTVSPIQVVSVLKELFTEFDKLCAFTSYTIGDCYVVLGLIDAEERNLESEAINVINMGFQMIEIIKDVKKRVSFNDVDMRIGVHTVFF